jgi:hypothetical protein
MFDRAASAVWHVGAAPHVDIAALRALAALLQDITPASANPSQIGDSSAALGSHDANRGVGICLFYALAGTVLRPDLWNEPLGPLMKIFPIFLLHLVALAILEER